MCMLGWILKFKKLISQVDFRGGVRKKEVLDKKETKEARLTVAVRETEKR